jgi:CheY-like chemotaxis protein
MYRTEPRLSNTRPRILVVDDDPIFLAVAGSGLAAAGFDSTSVGDGVEALEALDAMRFDGALIDLAMPRIDGFRLLGLVRGSERLRRLAIIVVTGRGDTEAVAHAMALGADGYERKPVVWPGLIERLRQSIENRASDAGYRAAAMAQEAAVRPQIIRPKSGRPSI